MAIPLQLITAKRKSGGKGLVVTSIDLAITGAALCHRLAVSSWSSCLTFLCPISLSVLDNNCCFTSRGFCEAPFVNACDVLFIVKDINNRILKMLSTSPAFWFLPKPLFHLGQTLSFSFTSVTVFYSMMIKFNKPRCMFGAMKSAPNYRLSVTGDTQGKAWICDAVVAKSFASFEDSLQDTCNWWSCQHLQQGVTHVWRTAFRVRICPA